MESKQIAVNSTSDIIGGQLEEARTRNTFSCSFCTQSFSKKFNLLRHVRNYHSIESMQLTENGTSNTIKVELEETTSCNAFPCSFCTKSFSKKFNLQRHMRTYHTIESMQLTEIEENEGKDTVLRKFSCSFCRKAFARKYNLMRHVGTLHSNESIPIVKVAISGNFSCPLCNKLFVKKFSLSRHIKNLHSNESIDQFAHNEKLRVISTFNKCPLCKEIFNSNETLSHFESIHDIKLEKSVLNFKSFEDFTAWKNEIEQETKSKFIRYGSTIIQKNGSSNFYFKCHRSGYFKSRSVGLRHLKLSGSCKIDAYCPASLKVMKSKEGECTAYFQSTHIGHSNDLRYLSLTYEERQFLAAKIALKIPFDDILESIRTSVGSDVQRLHLLTRKDLHNIVSSFKLSSNITKHTNTGDPNSNKSQIRKNIQEPIVIDERDPEYVVILKELSAENTVLNVQVHEQERKHLIESYTNLIKSLETPEQYALMKQNLKSLVPILKTMKASKTVPKAAKILGNTNLMPQRMFHVKKEKIVP